MKVCAIVCRFNQARSIISGAILRNLFPQLHVITSGFEAPSGSSIPQSIIQIANFWGLERYDRTSRRLDFDELITKSAYVLAADELVLDHMSVYDSKLAISKMSDFADDKVLIPIDPTGLDIEGIAAELAKAAVLTLRWAHSLLQTQLNVESILIRTQSGEVDVKTIIPGESRLFVDCNIARPLKTSWIRNGQTVQFNPRNLASFDIQSIKGVDNAVLSSRFEIDDYERFFLSKEWAEFLKYLCNDRKVFLISNLARQDISSLPGSVLALSHSMKTKVFD